MKIITTILILIYAPVILLSDTGYFPYRSQGAGVSEFFSEISAEQRNALAFIYGMEPYDSEELGVYFHGDRYVISGSQSIAKDCFSLLEDDRFLYYWIDSFNALGIMASVEPSRVDYERLTEQIRRMEGSDVRKARLVYTLGPAYKAVGRFGFEKSEAFLVARMSETFWEARRWLEVNLRSPNEQPFIIPAPVYAISAFTILGEEGSSDRLHSLLAGGEIRDDYFGSTMELIDMLVEDGHLRDRPAHQRRVELYNRWREENSSLEKGAAAPDEMNTENGSSLREHDHEGRADEQDVGRDAGESAESDEEARHTPPDGEEKTAGAVLAWVSSGVVLALSAGALWWRRQLSHGAEV